MIIRFFAYIRNYTHTKEVELEGYNTVKELLTGLCSKYGRQFEEKVYRDGLLGSEIIILVNGRHINHYDGVDTKLSRDDQIAIFPVVAGG